MCLCIYILFCHYCCYPILAIDFAENRLKIAEILYFKILENVMDLEIKRLQGKDLTVSM